VIVSTVKLSVTSSTTLQIACFSSRLDAIGAVGCC